MIFTALGGSSCVTYEPAPLNPEQILAAVEEIRYPTPPSPETSREGGEAALPSMDGRAFVDAEAPHATVSLATAAAWMRERGPDVREVLAAYHTERSVAEIATPLPNPTFVFGPLWGIGPDKGSTHEVVPFGSLGVTIPWSGRLARQDELHWAIAESARVEALARYRELFLDLRSAFTGLITARSRLQLQAGIVTATEQSVDVVRLLVDSGAAGGSDVALLELELARARAKELEVHSALVQVEARLAKLVGVHAGSFEHLSRDAVPIFPAELPDLASLKSHLVFQHPGLGRLRARYEVAERSLHLEVANQYPDLRVGPSFEGDTGQESYLLGLTLGIEIPAFDRNQQGIARAEHRRTEVRVGYEATLNRALVELERAHRTLELARERRGFLRDKALPKAHNGTRFARQALSAGAGSGLELLEARRAQSEIEAQVLEAELEVREAWIALERSVGFPILRFPSESDEFTLSEEWLEERHPSLEDRP